MGINRIIRRGDPLIDGAETGNGNVQPGYVLERDAADDVVPHSLAGGAASPVIVALERPDLTTPLTSAYAAGDSIKFAIPRPGDRFNARLLAGENVTNTERLESAGDGTLQEFSPETQLQATGLAIDAAGLVTANVAHNLPRAPSLDDVQAVIVEETDVDDYEANLKVISVDATNVTVGVIVETASATVGATVGVNILVSPSDPNGALFRAAEDLDLSGAASNDWIAVEAL